MENIPEDVRQRYQRAYWTTPKELQPPMKDLTCFGCAEEPNCPKAWLINNTNGFCAINEKEEL